MELILSRHGNTFGPNDPVVWAGATNDLALVEKGFEQARILGAELLRHEVRLAGAFCSPLRRTRDYAETALQDAGIETPVVVDDRLMEVDYGAWTGQTDASVADRFGEKALKDWNERSIWPVDAGWGPGEKELIAQVEKFTKYLQEHFHATDKILVVSSNGTLRYFLSLIEGELEKRIQNGSFKMKTGNVARLTLRSKGWHVDFWNLAPATAPW